MHNGRQVFVTEGNAEIRHSIGAALGAAGFDTVFFADGYALVASVMTTHPSCILLDRCVGEEMTLDVLRLLRKEHCLAPVLILYEESTVESAVKALRNGASDFIHRSTRGQELVDCVAEALDRSLWKARSRLSDVASLQIPGHDHLSIREREILGYILLGRSTKEIGRILDLSPRTVEAHRASIRKKTGNRTWVELALAAVSEPASMA